MQPCWSGKEQNKSVLLYHKEGFKKSSHGKIPLGDTYPRIRFSKKSQQEFLNEKGGSTAPSGFPLLNRRRHVKKVNRISWGSSALLHAELTYGSVSKWCITKADTWLSQIGPDSQSRQLGDSLQRKFLHGTFFFMVYFPIEGGMWL